MKAFAPAQKVALSLSTLPLLLISPQAWATDLTHPQESALIEVARTEADLPADIFSGYSSDEGSSLPSVPLGGADLAATEPSASGWSSEEMLTYGLKQGLGSATGGRLGLGEGYWSMAFQTGVIVHSPGVGNVSMSHQVYQRWLTQERASWGQPLSSSPGSLGISSTFSQGSYVYDPASQLIRQADKVLSGQHILTIGDSQVWKDSWVGYGIRKAGYQDVMFSCGGVGYLASRPGVCSSYSGGVLNNEWYLPLGSPRAIYIQGSGNDVWTNQDPYRTGEAARAVVRKLKQAYPGTQIIMTDLLSTQKAEHQGRAQMSNRLNQVAAEEGVTFLSFKFWISDFRAQYMLGDDVHLKDEYQDDMGLILTDSLVQALRGNTLKGGIYGYYSERGSAARFGAPTSTETRIQDGGVYQTFANNYTIYWSPREGTQAVWFGEDIGHTYRLKGYERGSGYPLTDEQPYLHGARQQFRQAGGQVTTYLWSPELGTHTIWEPGAIAHTFHALGGASQLGFPAESETAYSYGMRQVFQSSAGQQTRIYWSPNTGAQAMKGYGDIFASWVARGHGPALGFPASNERAVPGGSSQLFRTQGGYESLALWSPQTGTHFMNAQGAFYNWYRANGFTQQVGFPTTDEHLGSDGRYHIYFSSGRHLTWSEGEGLRVAG